MLRQIVIAGSGMAALRAAEMLRSEGYDGSLTLLGDEEHPPYDRTPLSKAVLTGQRTAESTVFRPVEELQELGVELLLGETVTGLDLDGGRVVTDRGRHDYDGLIVATGARARTLPHPAREGVHAIRSIDDAVELCEALRRQPQVVIVGAGFIGSEVASSARALGLDVTVLEAAPAPLTRVLGDVVGGLCSELHGENGTRLLCDARVDGLVGDDRVRGVRLADGRVLDADVVVVGVGAVPNIEWLIGSGLRIDDGVRCDATLCAGPPNVFAAGDLARWPNALFDGRSTRCEQWTNAAEQGRHAARNLLRTPAEREPYAGGNYFWSVQYGRMLQFTGSASAEVDIAWRSPDGASFLALFRDAGRLVGAFANQAPPLLMKCKALIEGHSDYDEALGVLGLDGDAGEGAEHARASGGRNP